MMRGFGSKPWHFVLDGSPCTWLDIEQTAHGTMERCGLASSLADQSPKEKREKRVGSIRKFIAHHALLEALQA